MNDGRITMRVKSNLDQIIYKNIMDDIIRSEYQMGETISIDKIAEKYETSRTPVSQAVKLLANNKILEIMPNGRARVPEIDEVQMKKICDARFMIERYATEYICRFPARIQLSFYDQLKKQAEKSYQVLKSGNSLEFNHMDVKFHRMIVAQCKNEYIDDAYKQIQGRFIVANYLYNKPQHEDFLKAAEDHKRIVETLQEGNLDVCVQDTYIHIFCLSGQVQKPDQYAANF